PLAEFLVLVGADEEVELGLRHLLVERAQRVDRVAGRIGPQLALIDLVPRLAGQREPQHGEPVLGARDGALAVLRVAGGDPEDAVELEVIERGARHGEVPVVDRIEGAAQNADGVLPVLPNFQVRTSPWPSTTNFCVVRPSRPTGPRACSLSVEMPISAPRPYS